MARDMDKNELIRYISVGGSGGGQGGYQEKKDYDEDRGFNGFWDFTKTALNVAGFIGQSINNQAYQQAYGQNRQGYQQNQQGYQQTNQGQYNRGGNPPNYVPPSPQFGNNNNNYYGQNQGGYGPNQGYGQNQGGYGQNQGYSGYNQGGY